MTQTFGEGGYINLAPSCFSFYLHSTILQSLFSLYPYPKNHIR